MKKITFIILVLIVGIITSCNSNDDNSGKPVESIIGTWKLTAELTDGIERSLGNCEIEETYIFGTAQVTHETYTSGSTFRGSDDDGGDDDNDDEGDDDSDDSGDDEATDDSSDDTDDNSDDDTGVCSVSNQKIAFWTKSGSVYNLDFSGTVQTMDVIFTDSNNKFYFEKTVVLNGQSRVKRYVFQRQ